MSKTDWYWCLTHQRAESEDDRDDPDNSLGPYESAEAAANWKDRHEERAAEWKAQDQAWEGTDADEG